MSLSITDTVNTVRISSTVKEPEIVSSFELRIKSSGREGEIVQEEYNIHHRFNDDIVNTNNRTETETVGRIGNTKHSELFIRDHPKSIQTTDT